ncbi:DUF6538 domain-containing protein [Rhizobium grahamii]|uniref:DUF6538 domain-containing protein n=1 Tax=Rhizobium grahamii TaxID=1120045 RepID=A0A370KQL3_9HYPH|nr:DUF6538 domain-containing protein [Rhizobium grahamii]RDJ11792.1 hypothetical protein B5K06_12265 [Rhizobium grahamii]
MAATYGDNLILRNKTYSFLYTVPREYRDRRGGKRQVVKSLKTGNYEEAKKRAALARLACILEYESNDFNDTKEIFIDIAKATAKRFGFEYVDRKKIANATEESFVELMSPAVEAIEDTPKLNRAEIATFGSAVEIPGLPMSKVFPRWKQLSPEKVKLKNEVDARDFWRKYERYTEDFINQMGDLDVLKMTEATLEEYRDTLVERVMNDEFKSENANKRMRGLRTMLKAVLKRDHKGVENPFREIEAINIDDAGKRRQFEEDEVRLLREKAANSPHLSETAKAMLLLTQNTGLGVKELAQMAPEDVVLSGDYPHLKIRPNEFRNYLKTKEREREIPLVGQALEIMKKFPNGFPEYTEPRGVRRLYSQFSRFFSTAVPGKSYVCYRHRISYLMRNSELKDQWQNAVMGHATKGQTGYYGGPVWLSKMHKLLMEALPEDNR